MKRSATPLLMLAPALTATGILVFFPVLNTLWLSLHNVVLFRPKSQPFVGLANYVEALHSQAFWDSLGRSVVWVVGSVSLQFLIGLGVALLLNRDFRMRGLVRAIIVVPWALPSVIIGLVWTWMLDFNFGILNQIGVAFGLLDEPVAWLAQSGTAMAAVMAAIVWQGFPFFAITLLAGLQSIPHDLYEGAEIDGANAWYTFVYVTVPGLLPVMVTALLLRMIWVANSLDLILVMTGGGPGTSTQTLPLHAFLTAWSGGNYGSGAALSTLLTLILLSVITIYVVRGQVDG
ncbi:MAG: sugar ABC transporter permease [Acetobacteraceae bacterium]|nr:sugar ABC transporter permease [Acetobacteraceae bacterium]